VFKFNPKGQYMMPAHFGYRMRGRGPAPKYHDVTTMTISFLSTQEALSQYLPEAFQVGAEPLVHVYCTMNRQVDWLAGRAYNLVGVDVSAVFKGEVDKNVVGTFNLVTWENDCDPLISGRETLGIPKIYADIEDHSIIEGEWRTSASLRGEKFMDLEIKNLKPVPQAELEEWNKWAGKGNWMGWLYVPNIGKPGPSVSHATCVPAGGITKEAWSGEGKLTWHKQTWEQNPAQCHIINALADLPVKEIRVARVSKAGTALETETRTVRAMY
jgi:acetoacetate decarboxylase